MNTLPERRRHSRNSMRTIAMVVAEDGLERLPATMFNGSTGGAKIVLARDADLPPTFDLLFDRSLEQCRLVWKAGLSVGICFDQSSMRQR